MSFIFPHEQDDAVAVLRTSIQEDNRRLGEYDAAQLSRQLLESNNWDLALAWLKYKARAQRPSPSRAASQSLLQEEAGSSSHEEAGASSRRVADFFKYPEFMDAVLSRTDKVPHPKYHEVSIQLAAGAKCATDEEVECMTIMGWRDMPEDVFSACAADVEAMPREATSSMQPQLEVDEMIEIQKRDGRWYKAKVLRRVWGGCEPGTQRFRVLLLTDAHTTIISADSGVRWRRALTGVLCKLTISRRPRYYTHIIHIHIHIYVEL